MTIFDPTITDITRIASTMSSLRSLSQVIAYGLIFFLVPLEVIRQNMETLEGRSSYTGVFIRLTLVFLGLILYDRIFNFLINSANIVEMSILSEGKWSDLLAQLADFFETRKVTLMTSLPIVFTWMASFLALLAKNILYWVRFCLLAVLYFVGPIAFAFNIFGPTSFLPKAWFKNVIQISLWTVVMKIIVRVMIELQIRTYLAAANIDLDVLTLIGINTTFVVMIVLSPYFTAQFISGQTFGPFAVMASTFLASKGWIVTKVGAAMAERGARPIVIPGARQMAQAGQRIITASKTAIRERLFRPNDRSGGKK